MRKSLILTAAITALVILGPMPTEEQTERSIASYVGAKRCKVCHLHVFDSWEKTKHAEALAALKGEEEKNPACLPCHSTGFRGGGYGTPGSVVDLGGVQCEACHGAGSLYSKSSVMRKAELSHALGLVPVDSATCVTCHNSKSPTFKGFAYEAGLLTGTHSRRRK